MMSVPTFVTCRRVCRIKRCTSVRSGFTASGLAAESWPRSFFMNIHSSETERSWFGRAIRLLVTSVCHSGTFFMTWRLVCSSMIQHIEWHWLYCSMILATESCCRGRHVHSFRRQHWWYHRHGHCSYGHGTSNHEWNYSLVRSVDSSESTY